MKVDKLENIVFIERMFPKDGKMRKHCFLAIFPEV